MSHKYFEIPSDNFETFKFSELDLNELDKAISEGLTIGRAKVLEICENTEAPNFENTIYALEQADESLDQVLNILFNLFNSNTNEEVQKIVEKYSPILAEYSNEILLNPELFERVKSVFSSDQSELTAEQKMLLEKSYKSFQKNGANLSEEDKKKLVKIDSELSTLSPQFSKNVLEATNAFEWTTKNKEDLKGLPEAALETALAEAKQKGKEEGTYLFSLQYPSLLPILKYCENREVRKLFMEASSTKATQGDLSNQEIILKLVKLRSQKASLLGFRNYAEFVLQDRMAKTPENVFDFLNDLKKYSLDPAKKDVEKVKKFAEETDGIKDFMPWDMSYYSEKLKKAEYDVSDEETKPYFSLENVLNGAFVHAEKLYGLQFKETTEVEKYHEDVRTFEVWSEKDFIGVFYTDFFPRSSKKPGAWCTRFREQGLLKGKIRRPHTSIVCNFTKPTKSTPSLLTYDEVRTLFHEFGHALHSLMSQCTYRSLSGTNVYWDFVELPSQIMENWTLEEDSLKLFAKHYETGEIIPTDLIQKLKKASSFMAGYASARQLRFAYLDMFWHTAKPEDIESDVAQFEDKATDGLNLLPKVDGAITSCAFAHIFAGGYAAGYYSYKWAEVLDADAFEYFQEKGVFNQEVATSFKTNILERGGTEHPEELYIKFRGRKPDVKALLRRDQLI